MSNTSFKLSRPLKTLHAPTRVAPWQQEDTGEDSEAQRIATHKSAIRSVSNPVYDVMATHIACPLQTPLALLPVAVIVGVPSPSFARSHVAVRHNHKGRT